MITVLYSIEKNQLFDGSSKVTIFFENEQYVVNMNRFADFIMYGKKLGCVFVEKKKTYNAKNQRFQATLRKMLGEP